MLQQLQKIPIDSFYRRTVPKDTHDCESDSTFNYDEVPSAFFAVCCHKFLIQEVISGFFECMNTTFGCIVPCYGGIYMPQNYSICTNSSYFDHGIIGSCFANTSASLKTSCKMTDINYGPLHVTSDQNTTRWKIINTVVTHCSQNRSWQDAIWRNHVEGEGVSLEVINDQPLGSLCRLFSDFFLSGWRSSSLPSCIGLRSTSSSLQLHCRLTMFLYMRSFFLTSTLVEKSWKDVLL